MLAFLNATKYPASFAFLLMTLGPTITLIPVLDRVRGRLARWLIVFGRVPFFFYVLHIPLIHAMALVMSQIRLGFVSPWLFANHPMGNPPPPENWIAPAIPDAEEPEERQVPPILKQPVARFTPFPNDVVELPETLSEVVVAPPNTALVPLTLVAKLLVLVLLVIVAFTPVSCVNSALVAVRIDAKKLVEVAAVAVAFVTVSRLN